MGASLHSRRCLLTSIALHKKGVDWRGGEGGECRALVSCCLLVLLLWGWCLSSSRLKIDHRDGSLIGPVLVLAVHLSSHSAVASCVLSYGCRHDDDVICSTGV